MSTEQVTKEPLADAQLKKVELEIEELRRKKTWGFKFTQSIPLITALVAVGGLLLNTQQFLSAQKAQLERDRTAKAQEEKQQMENLEREAATKEREFRKPFWEKQINTYFEASDVASTIATLPAGNTQRKRAEERFMQLYYGPLVLVEDEEVMKAKVNLRNCIDGLDEECTEEPSKTFRLQTLSLALANKCRASIGISWTIDLKNLYLQDERQRPLP